MPTTVNGIGTHYYGKREAASRIGSCQHCGARGTLESYTTRLWFVIVFIPIIPLKRVRILDECPSCRRHWAANPEQYETSRQLAVSGALEKYRDHPSVETALVAHAQLLTFHMHKEADTFRETALEKFGDRAELQAGLAAHLDQTGRWPEATAFYDRAFALNSDLADVRAALAWRHLNANELDQAYELLDFLRQPGAGQTYNLLSLEELAKAYQKKNNHERALELREHLVREVPDFGKQYAFRKSVIQSEKALGRSTSILPPTPVSVGGIFSAKSGTHAPWVRWAALGTVAALFFVIGMAGMNEYRRTHRTLQVVNGFAQPLKISIDGKTPIEVAVRTPFTLSEGKHHIVVTSPIEKQEDVILQSGYWSRWTYSPVWIFNLENVAMVNESKIVYSVVPQAPSGRWLNESELNYVPHVDYAFEQPPQTMQLDQHTESITKIHVGTAAIPPGMVFLGLSQREDKTLALTFAEGYLNRNPNDTSLLRMYIHDSEADATAKRVTEFLKSGLWRKPISVRWHRAYHGRPSIAATQGAMINEYDAKLLQDPDDASLIYLRGSISPTRSDQLKYFRMADEKNPQLGWPRYSLANDAYNRGEWREAKEFCDAAVNALRFDSWFQSLRHNVQIANGDAAILVAEYRANPQSNDYIEAYTTMVLMTDALASQEKYDEAKQFARQWMMQKLGTSANSETMANLEPLLDYLCGTVDGYRENQDRPNAKAAVQFLFHALLANGEPASACGLEGADRLLEDWTSLLAVSLSYTLAGDADKANEWLTKACDKMRESYSDYQRAASVLQNDKAPSDEELEEITMTVWERASFLAMVAQRFPDRKSEINQLAQRLNVSRLPPYLLVKRVTELP